MASRKTRRWTMGSIGAVVGLIAALLVTSFAASQVLNSAQTYKSTFDAADGNLVHCDAATLGTNYVSDGSPDTCTNAGTSTETGGDPRDWDSKGVGTGDTTTPATLVCAARDATPVLQGSNCVLDKATGSTDDSFGQGSKEDSPNPTVVNGSIPNQKSDLTRFYMSQEQASTHSYLYLGWERANTLGNANMDFEFNQNKCQWEVTPNSNPVTYRPTADSTCDTDKVVPVRKSGDLLITFDFEKGGKAPTLGLLQWLVSGTKLPDGVTPTAADCFSSNAMPCWGAESGKDSADNIDDNKIDLSAAGWANGQVNLGFSVTDPIPPVPTTPGYNTLADRTFGEAAIDLVASQIFPSDKCVNYGSALLKSRSSTSFTAEMKDFISPMPTSVSNCGTITIHKQDDQSSALSGAYFTLYKNTTPTTVDSYDSATDPAATKATKLDGDLTAANTTSFKVLDASIFPTAPFDVTIQNTNGTNKETVTVSAVNTTTNVLTIGSRGTTPTLHASGSDVIWTIGCSPSGSTWVDPSDHSKGSYASCELTNIPFGDYWVVETTFPTGYSAGTGGSTASVHLANTTAEKDAVVEFTNNRDTVTLNVAKVDENGQSIPVCDPQDVQQPCVRFTLYGVTDGATTALPTGGLANAQAGNADQTFTVDNSTITGTFGASDIYVLVENEVIKVATVAAASSSTTTFTVAQGGRGALGTTIAVHAASKTVQQVTKGSNTNKACSEINTGDWAVGQCGFTGVDVGFHYWIEETAPTGFSSDTPKFANVPLTGWDGTKVFTFTDTHLYKVIVLVCRQSDMSLKQANVKIAGQTTATQSVTSTSGLDLTAGSGTTVEQELCSIGGSASANGTRSDLVPSASSTDSYPASVNIPK